VLVASPHSHVVLTPWPTSIPIASPIVLQTRERLRSSSFRLCCKQLIRPIGEAEAGVSQFELVVVDVGLEGLLDELGLVFLRLLLGASHDVAVQQFFHDLGLGERAVLFLQQNFGCVEGIVDGVALGMVREFTSAVAPAGQFEEGAGPSQKLLGSLNFFKKNALQGISRADHVVKRLFGIVWHNLATYFVLIIAILVSLSWRFVAFNS
jgi:hypothetical protein